MNRVFLCVALFICVFISPSVAQNKVVAVKFNKALLDYYGLKNALATDNAEDAQRLAGVLLLSVKEVPPTGFASNTQHKLWMEQSGVILKKLTELAANDNLDVQRKSFRDVSDAFVTLAGELKVNAKKAFVQYCPMGKYTWLNEVKEVQNPFYGSKMYDCGEVKWTISKK